MKDRRGFEMKDRRGFLKALGIGAAGAAVAPLVSQLPTGEAQLSPGGTVPKSDTVPVTLTYPSESFLNRETVEKCHSVLEGINNSVRVRHDLTTLDTDLKLCDEGVACHLDSVFCNKKPPEQWHAGLIASSGFTGICRNSDTYKSHCGWDEFINYEGERPELNYSSFQFTGAGTIRGFFVAGGNESVVFKDTWLFDSILFSINLFPQGDISVVAGDMLAINVTRG